MDHYFPPTAAPKVFDFSSRTRTGQLCGINYSITLGFFQLIIVFNHTLAPVITYMPHHHPHVFSLSRKRSSFWSRRTDTGDSFQKFQTKTFSQKTSHGLLLKALVLHMRRLCLRVSRYYWNTKSTMVYCQSCRLIRIEHRILKRYCSANEMFFFNKF